VLESIKEFIEFLAEDLAQIGATLAPFLLAGLLGLYVLWLVIGYLRVSQVGLEAQPQPVLPLLPPGQAPPPALEAGAEAAADGDAVEPAAVPRPRGVPYCPFDGLLYPLGATFCAACERDLLVDCVTGDATVPASEAFCYRCGTPTGAVEPSHAG
jgi:hypothetical protein